MKVEKEIDKKQQIESGFHPVDTVISPKFITQNSNVLKSKRKGEATDFPVMIGRSNNVTSSSHLQTSSIHNLDQNIL